MKNSTAGFVMGLLVGAVGGLLLAPASGAETREELRRGIQRGREQLRELEIAAEERLGTLLEEIQDKTQRLVLAGSEMVESRRQDLQEAIQVAKRALAEEREILMRSRQEASRLSSEGEDAP